MSGAWTGDPSAEADRSGARTTTLASGECVGAVSPRTRRSSSLFSSAVRRRSVRSNWLPRRSALVMCRSVQPTNWARQLAPPSDVCFRGRAAAAAVAGAAAAEGAPPVPSIAWTSGSPTASASPASAADGLVRRLRSTVTYCVVKARRSLSPAGTTRAGATPRARASSAVAVAVLLSVLRSRMSANAPGRASSCAPRSTSNSVTTKSDESALTAMSAGSAGRSERAVAQQPTDGAVP